METPKLGECQVCKKKVDNDANMCFECYRTHKFMEEAKGAGFTEEQAKFLRIKLVNATSSFGGFLGL